MTEEAAEKIVEEQDVAKITEALNIDNPQQQHQKTNEREKVQDLPAESTTISSEKSIQEKESDPIPPATAAAQTVPTIVAETVSKKRKLSDASATNNPAVKKPTEPASSQKIQKQTLQRSSTHTPPPPAQQTPQTQSNQHSFDLEDYSIIPQTVRDLLTLLQLYGALTAGQLEYNLPVNNSPSLIQDVLEVLVCIGLVQKVQEEDESKTPRYCVNRGVPRADAVNLPVLQHEILAAHRQANRSFERTKLLQTALQDDNSNPKDVLQKLLHDYPEIQQDPVYMTALRQCHVDAPTSSSTGEKVRKKAVTSTTPKQRKVTPSKKAEFKVAVTKDVTNKSPPSTVSKSTTEPRPSMSPVPEATNEESIHSTSQATMSLSDGVTQSQ
ncbi:hypothetical protein FisN_13Lh182 [Fistulifera solaris]|uniref:Uncharacterized protein n=1 Tax=Fistulifera solaris TaxID=1519565 RepID=A0A1Z5KMU5_FISSO|nr:hypothetical protein FisN_13Lh182 [Fistulifera solaris]|eukprot:GAX27258.1 hypothetical protein FisN_13Lh182 [Fistulifera solaris]